MPDASLYRFLDLVERELGAVDAYLKLGGKEPSGGTLLFHEIDSSTWVVVVFAEQPEQPSPLQARLAALSTTFRSTIEAAAATSASPRTPADMARQRLDEELFALAERAGAARAFVFDFDSPVIWGASRLALEGTGANNELLERAAAELREQQGAELRGAHGHTVRLTLASGQEALARPFASIYVLALLFSSPLSVPIALGAVLHAAGLIERLVLALPPVDPDPGGKLIRLPSRR